MGISIVFIYLAGPSLKLHLNNYFDDLYSRIIVASIAAALLFMAFPFRTRYGDAYYKYTPELEPSILEKQDVVILGSILLVAVTAIVILVNI